MLDVTKDNFAAEVLEAPGKILVDYYGDGCVPCAALMPHVHAFAENTAITVEVDNDLTGSFQNFGTKSILSDVENHVNQSPLNMLQREIIPSLPDTSQPA